VLEQDRKRYQESGVSFSVSQVEMVGFGPFAALKERLAKALDELTQRELLDFTCLMVTDITRETSLLLCSGKGKFVDAVSYPRVEPGLYEMKGVLSRKKQMLPYLLDLIRSIVA
jgi:manganese-dependent inorganic pyrophosphatase